MGLEPGYPVVRSNDPAVPLTLSDANFAPFGTLGASDTRTNVTCRRQSPDGAQWYKLLNAERPGNQTNAAYVSVASCEVVSSPWRSIPECKDLSGCLKKAAAGAVVVAGVAAAVRRATRRA